MVLEAKILSPTTKIALLLQSKFVTKVVYFSWDFTVGSRYSGFWGVVFQQPRTLDSRECKGSNICGVLMLGRPQKYRKNLENAKYTWQEHRQTLKSNFEKDLKIECHVLELNHYLLEPTCIGSIILLFFKLSFISPSI